MVSRCMEQNKVETNDVDCVAVPAQLTFTVPPPRIIQG